MGKASGKSLPGGLTALPEGGNTVLGGGMMEGDCPPLGGARGLIDEGIVEGGTGGWAMLWVGTSQ